MATAAPVSLDIWTMFFMTDDNIATVILQDCIKYISFEDIQTIVPQFSDFKSPLSLKHNNHDNLAVDASF